MLILNVLKGFKKKKLQLFVLIMMICLSTAIYVAMNTALDRLQDRYYKYIDEQSVEDFSFGVINNYGNDLDEIAFENDFVYDLEVSKVITDGKYVIKAFPYYVEKQINKPYLVKGRFPENYMEVTVLPSFAKKNNLEIGGDYVVNGMTYKIVGYAYNPSYIYPIISLGTPMYDEKYNNIIYINDIGYEDFIGIKDDIYVARLNGQANYFNDEKSSIISKLFEENGGILEADNNSEIRNMRISSLSLEFNSTKVFADKFLYFILFLSLFVVLIIMKRRIEDEKIQIGVLKTLGYEIFPIAFSYMIYPIFSSLIGGLLGYILGIGINGIVASSYLGYYNVPLSGFIFNSKYLLISLLVPLLILGFISLIVVLFLLRKKPLSLLKEGSNLKVTFFNKIVNKLTRKLSFKSRLKYSLASRSLGRLIMVFLTSFFSGMLIIFVFIGSNLFDYMIDKSFEGMRFKYMVSYIEPQTDSDGDSDLVLSSSGQALEVISENGVKKVDLDNSELSLIGLDKQTKYIDLINEKTNSLTSYLDNYTTVISQNISELLNVNVGDSIVVRIGNIDIIYKVGAVCDEYTSNTIYVSRSDLSEHLGMELSYTVKYSNNDIYSDISNLNSEEISSISSVIDLPSMKDNMRRQIHSSNTSLYIVAIFGSFMAIIIIGLISNVVVGENRKTISLMKVMGYKDKEIRDVILNIYTPFVIIAYFLSIPVITSVLKNISRELTSEIDMVIPINISMSTILLGLNILLWIYYIAINISRNVLNKTSLSLVLKGE